MKKLPLFLAAVVALSAHGRVDAEPITALTSTGTLVTFDSATPGTLIGGAVTITGLTGGQVPVAIDHRPIDWALVGIGYNPATGAANVYQINRTSGTATLIGPAITGAPAGLTGVGFDFNPAANALRIVSNAGQNFRITTGGTGTFNTDTAINPPPAAIVASAYSNNFAGTSSTTLFGIDAANNRLVTQGGAGGTPSPNLGQLFNVATLSGVTGTAVSGFDISGPTGVAYLTTGNQLFTLNTATGAATLVGTIGTGLTILNIAAVPEPGSLVLAGAGAAGLFGLWRRKRAKK